ncbi:MAG: hypothetical protein ACOC90_00070 [Bacteroidota bacterium]
MGRIACFLFLMVCLISPFPGFAAAVDLIEGDSFIISYIISLHGEDKGYMEIKVNRDQFESKYYNITRDDRIPFYAGSKSGVLRDDMYASKLVFNDEEYEIFYDLRKRAPKDLPAFLDPKKSRDERAALVNQSTGLVELAFEQIPMVAFENIILGFLSGTIESETPMMMFEGANDLKMKIFFKKQNDENLPECVSDKYACYRQNIPGKPGKFLFSVLVNKDGIPVKFASRSRWEFKVDGIGEIKSKKKDIEPYLVKKAEKETKKIFQQSRARIEGLELSDFNLTKENLYRYDYHARVRFLPDMNKRKEALEYLCKQVDPGNTCSDEANVVAENKSDYSVCAERQEVCEVLERVGGYRNCEYSVAGKSIEVSGEELLNIVKNETGLDAIDFRSASRLSWVDYYIINTETREKIDKNIEEVCKQYLSDKYSDNKDIEYKDYEIITVREEISDEDGKRKTIEKPGTIIISYEEKTPIPDYDVMRAAKYVIYQKLYNREIGRMEFLDNYDMDLLNKDERRYCLSVPSREVTDIIRSKRENECQQARARAGGFSYKKNAGGNGLYDIHGKGGIDMEEISDLIMEELTGKHPRLDYTRDEIKKKGTYWIFPVISSEVNICK